MKSITLITGATSGIGEALANNFYNHSTRVILVGRRKNRLEKLSQHLKDKYKDVYYFKADITKKSDITKLKDYIHNELECTVQHVFNNAGFGLIGDFKDLDIQQQKNMITLNISSLVELTHIFMNDFLKHQDQKLPSGILNISSIASFFPGPKMAVYFASKAFVTSFSEALRQELMPYGITVCNYCPGPVKTEFLQVAGVSQENIHKENTKNIPSAQETALDAIETYVNQKRQKIQGFANRIIVCLAGILPSPFFAKLIKKMNEDRM